MTEDELRERVAAQIEHSPAEAAVAAPARAWAGDDPSEHGRACGERIARAGRATAMGGPWFPSGDEAESIVERELPGGARRARSTTASSRAPTRRPPSSASSPPRGAPAPSKRGSGMAEPKHKTWILTGVAGELPDQRRAWLRRDRPEGAPAQPGRAVRARRRGRSSTSPGSRRSAGSPGCARRCSRTATPIWPQGSKKHPEAYPWRVEAEPVLDPRRGRLRPRRGAGRRARARRQVAGRALAPGLPGAAANDRRRRPRPPARAHGRGRRRALIHDRHFSRAEADAHAADAGAAADRAAPRQGLAHRRRGARGPLGGVRRATAAAPRGARSARRSSRSAACWRRSRRPAWSSATSTAAWSTSPP